MLNCFFASDLHGRESRYEALFKLIAAERPGVVLLGGDLLPHAFGRLDTGLEPLDFIPDYLRRRFTDLRRMLGDSYPRVLMIMGNDDPRSELETLRAAGEEDLWEEIHGRSVKIGGVRIYGYACVPPTPFQLKDWERYDVSRFVDPGCISPEDGIRTVRMNEREIRFGTIETDLVELAGDDDLRAAVFLFHTPAHGTALDRAALDGKMVDHVPLDVHVGSIAVRRFIRKRSPALTLHGHVHETTRLTGKWREELGGTTMLTAAHDGPELALVRFDLHRPRDATRELI